jgi:hypothetical protein
MEPDACPAFYNRRAKSLLLGNAQKPLFNLNSTSQEDGRTVQNGSLWWQITSETESASGSGHLRIQRIASQRAMLYFLRSQLGHEHAFASRETQNKSQRFVVACRAARETEHRTQRLVIHIGRLRAFRGCHRHEETWRVMAQIDQICFRCFLATTSCLVRMVIRGCAWTCFLVLGRNSMITLSTRPSSGRLVAKVVSVM